MFALHLTQTLSAHLVVHCPANILEVTVIKEGVTVQLHPHSNLLDTNSSDFSNGIAGNTRRVKGVMILRFYPARKWTFKNNRLAVTTISIMIWICHKRAPTSYKNRQRKAREADTADYWEKTVERNPTAHTVGCCHPRTHVPISVNKHPFEDRIHHVFNLILILLKLEKNRKC